jgi:acyl-CoA reductase-like NAD-dependent aldehyde dehydrogenase
MNTASLVPGETLMRIDGKESPAASGKTYDLVNPATGDVVGRAPDGDAADVDRAVAAARAAMKTGTWRKTTADDKARVLWRCAELIEAHADELTALETQTLGAPQWFARFQVANAAEAFRYYAGAASRIHGRTSDITKPEKPGLAFTIKEPIGVVGLITPWNFGLMAAAWKLAPALAAGCATVLKPALETPLSTLRLAALMAEAGVPDGLVNVVTGGGAAGAAIANHPEIRKLSFTGSVETARQIIAAAAGNLKRLTLELGGKSPVVICEDADLARAIPAAASVLYANSGQVCVAGSRLFVHRSVAEQVMQGMAEMIKQIPLGDPADPATMMGPLVSSRQLARVTELVESGRRDGARIVFGGARRGETGFFFEPTLIADVDPSMRVMREEIFGPVVCLSVFDELDEIMEQLNDTEYGLAAYIWTRDLVRAHRFAAAIEAGNINLNAPGFDYGMPFGGLKQSGWGSEHGPDALDAFLSTKTVYVDLTP